MSVRKLHFHDLAARHPGVTPGLLQSYSERAALLELVFPPWIVEGVGDPLPERLRRLEKSLAFDM